MIFNVSVNNILHMNRIVMTRVFCFCIIINSNRQIIKQYYCSLLFIYEDTKNITNIGTFALFYLFIGFILYNNAIRSALYYRQYYY